MSLDRLMEQPWYQERITAVRTRRRAVNRMRIKMALGSGTPREALAPTLRLPENYIRMLLGEPALAEEGT